MGKYSDLILISDFDQTLTDRHGQIPSVNLDAIAAFISEGGIFTLATGRSLPMSRYRFHDVPVNAPIIACNGAICFDPRGEKLLFCHPLPESIMDLMRYYEQTYPQLRLEVHCLDKHYVFNRDPRRDAYLRQQKAAFACVPWEQIPHPQIKFCMYSCSADPFQITPDSEEGRFFSWLERDCNQRGNGSVLALNSLPGLVEVQSAHVSKGSAARKLADTVGRSTLVCVGDAINDLSMLEEADLAFVPADCSARIRSMDFPQAAPCGEGTISHVIHLLDQHLQCRTHTSLPMHRIG